MMVEIDGPGHAAIWCKGYPEICPSATCLEPLNPATNATFELLDDLLDDLTGGVRGSGLFPDNIIHLGGDEVNTACYESTPSIASWLKTKGLTPDGGYEYFVKQYQAIAHAKGRDVAGWEEIWHHFGTELDKSTIIHQWLGGSTAMPNLTAHGAFDMHDTRSFAEPTLLLCGLCLAFYSNTRTRREQVTVGCGLRMEFGIWTDWAHPGRPCVRWCYWPLRTRSRWHVLTIAAACRHPRTLQGCRC